MAARLRVRSPLLVGVVAAAVYARSIAFGFVDLDDRDLVVEAAPFLGQPSSLWRAFGRSYMHVVDGAHPYYRPLVTASYALDAQWAGSPRPLAYHATNVVLFAVASALFYRLLSEFAFGRGVALAAALVFAVHPALVPAVAWIPGRNDVLLAVFALAAWLAFVRERTRTTPAASGGLPLRAAHFALFALALLTKETAIVLPLVCALHLALVQPAAWERFRRPRTLAGFAFGWGVLAGARLVAGGGRVPAFAARPAMESVRLVAASLGKLLVPVHTTVLADADDVSVWPGLLAAAALLAGTCLVAGVRKGVIALGAATFALFLAPAVLLPGTLVVDHRLVLPACGAMLAAAEIVRALAPEPRVLGAFAATTVAALAAVTVAYEGAFRDPRTFAREAVAGAPRSPLAHFCLGQSYQRDGADERALAEYRVALSLGPAEVVHNHIAVIHMARGAWPDAERELAAEIAVNPRYGRAYGNLGIVLRNEGRLRDACAAEDRAVALAPDDARWREERATDCAP